MRPIRLGSAAWLVQPLYVAVELVVAGAATALWTLSGLCSAAVGFVPVDQRPALHAVVAAPVFVLQPLAVLATAAALRRTSGAVPGWVVTTGFAVGGLTAAAAAAFGLRLGEQTWVGGLERLALWPAYLWLGALGAVLLARRGVSGRS